MLGWLLYPNLSNETNYINPAPQKADIRKKLIILIFDMVIGNLQQWVKCFTQLRQIYIESLEQKQETSEDYNFIQYMDQLTLPKENKQEILHYNLNFLQGQTQILNPIIQRHVENWKFYDNWSKISEFYKDLDKHHDYVQWFFPNFFKSQFNQKSHRLTIAERNLIIQNEKAKNSLKELYLLFLRSIGIKYLSGELSIEHMGQFVKCFQTNSHILFRIQRLLASLSVLGYRYEALKFIDFLNQSKLEYPTITIFQFNDYGKLKEEFIASNQQLNQNYRDFNNVKYLYVEQDLLNEKWVTPQLLTTEIIEL